MAEGYSPTLGRVDFKEAIIKFEKITLFFDTMPKVAHTVKVTNPKTKKKGEVVIEGIGSFFE